MSERPDVATALRVCLDAAPWDALDALNRALGGLADDVNTQDIANNLVPRAAVSAHHAQVVAAVEEMDAHVANDDVSLFLWRDDLLATLATLATLTPEPPNAE